jgi:hypothetical protein
MLKDLINDCGEFNEKTLIKIKKYFFLFLLILFKLINKIFDFIY